MNSKTVTIQRYAMFLKELYETIKTPQFINGSYLAIKKHKISGAVLTVLINEKYISKTVKNKNNLFRYTWNVGEPNIHMAEVILSKTNNYNYNKVFERVGNKIKMRSQPLYIQGSHSKLDGTVENSLPFPKKKTNITAIDTTILQDMVNRAVIKALTPPVKTRKVLRFRNPFYWVTE